jgi:hypothetical protein
LLEAPDDPLVGLVVRDEPALDLGPARALEGAVRRHRPDDREAVLLRRRVVVGAEGRRHVHDAGAVLRGDEGTRDHDARARVRRQLDDLERARVGEAHVLRAAAHRAAGEIAEVQRLPVRPAAVVEHDRTGPRDRAHQDAPVAPLVLAVLEVRRHGGGDVRRQCPRGRRPDDELAWAAVGEREGDVDRTVADVLVAERQLVAREHRAAARAVRQHAVARHEQALLVQPLQQPPHRLDVLVAVRDVGVVVVEPVGHPVRQVLPLGLVLEDTRAGARVELGDAVGLDGLLAVEPELLLDLDLDRQTVRVPARDPRHVPALRRAEAADQVLQRAREDVVDARPAVRRRRTFEEDEGRVPLRPLERPLEEPLHAPGCQELALERVGGDVGPGRERHGAGDLGNRCRTVGRI